MRIGTSHRFVIADVFTEQPFGGNQLAVFPDAQGLSDRAMQALAREFHFAETTFAFPNADTPSSIRLRIFTPRAEVPFAGHPTIGTAAVLAHVGTIPAVGTVVFEEGVGPVPVEVRLSGDAATTSLTLDRQVEHAPSQIEPGAMGAVLSLKADCVRGSWFASAGLPFCFVHVATVADVDRAILDRRIWRETLAAARSSNVFFFAGSTAPGSTLHARMFAPALGIEEDPATGSGAVALAASLASALEDADGHFAWRVEQGVAMGRPSVMEVSVRKRCGIADRLRLSGSSTIVGVGRMTVPAAYRDGFCR